MISQYYDYDSWNHSNRDLINYLSVSADIHSAKVFPGIHSALSETLIALSSQFMIKKKVFTLIDHHPVLHMPLNYLAMNGFDIIPIQMKDDHLDMSFVDQVDVSTLAVILPMDLPFLPHKFDHSELVKELNSKRCFSIQLSSNLYNYTKLPQNINDYEGQLIVLADEVSLGIFGQKINFDPLISSGMKWDFNKISQKIDSFGKASEQKGNVLEFESKALGGSKSFGSTISRSFDRAFIYWEDMDASALISQLKRDFSGFDDQFFETPSLSRWGGLKAMDWMSNWGLNKNQIRGLLNVDNRILSDSLSQAIEDARSKIAQLQGG